MNTDIKDLGRLLKFKDPLRVAAIAGCVVAVGLLAFVAVSLVGLRGESSFLEAQYEDALATLERSQVAQASTPGTLQTELEQAKSELSDIRAAFPAEREVADEVSRYYGYASAIDTQLLRVEPMLPPPAEQGGYGSSQFLIEAEGPLPNLLLFLQRIVEGPYQTLTLDNVLVTAGSPATASARLTTRYVVEPDVQGVITDTATSGGQ